MKKREKLLSALLCLAFAALGGCLLLAGAGTLRAEEVYTQTVSFGGGKGRLYRPEMTAGETVTLWEEEEGDAHAGHGDVVTPGRSAAVLLLGGRSRGGEALAVELARRGVAVLLPDDGTPAQEAWEWLAAQSFTRASTMAVAASGDRAAELLAADPASRILKEAAAAVVLGDGDTLSSAAGYRGRNLLVLTAREAPEEARRAFLGPDWDGRRDFTGYFSEGTARAAVAVGRRSFSVRPALETVLDWQGSALGHAVELPDSDLICSQLVFCRVGAAFCAAAALAALFPRRRGGRRKPTA